VLLRSIEPRHLTNLAHTRALWVTGFYLIVEYYIHHITINFHVDDDVMEKNALSSRDARGQLIRCAEPRHSSILGAGSWCSFWFDHIFRSMISGQVMAKIRHGGGSRAVAFWPFTEVDRCFF